MWILFISGLILLLIALIVIWLLLRTGSPLIPERKDDRPTLWWHVDDSQVNARHWLDWGNRATREPNEPYLKICQARAIDLWGETFRIEPMIGRRSVIEKLLEKNIPIPEGADRCPPQLWMAWCRAVVLNRFGGFWMDGSNLPLSLSSSSQLLSRLGTSAVMFNSAGWSPQPNHPVWKDLEEGFASLIAQGDQSWGTINVSEYIDNLWKSKASGSIRYDTTAEMINDKYGRKLDLDTLLGQTEWQDGITEDKLWLPLPFPGNGRDGLERASQFLWFTRMSVEQILEAPFVWAQFARRL